MIGGGRTRLQPVFVHDVATAVLRIAETEAASSQVYELGGPQTLGLKQCFEGVASLLGRHPRYFSLPFPLARAVALVVERLPGAPLTLAQVELQKKGSIADPPLPGLEDLGIVPKART